MRKFISLRKKIFRRAEGEKFSCPRKYFFVRIEILRLAHGREFPFGRKGISLGKEGWWSGQREAKEGEGLVPWRDTERG